MLTALFVAIWAKCSFRKSASFSQQKCAVCTREFPISALDILVREVVDISCCRLGQQFEKALLLCQLIKLFGVLGSKK